MKKLLNLDQSLLIIFSNGTILATFIMIFLTFGVLISESYLIWNHKKIDYIYINSCPFSPHFKTHIQLFTYTFIQHCYCIHRALFLSHTYIHDTSWPVISQNYASVGEREGSPWAVTNCPSTCCRWSQCTKYVVQLVCRPLLFVLLLVHLTAMEKS